MINKFLIYLIVFLLGTTSLFSYFSYVFYGQKQVAIASLEEQKKTILDMQNSLLLKDSSCKIDDTSVAEFEIEKQTLQSKIDSLNKKIIELNKRGPLTIPSRPDIKNEANNNAEKSNVLDGDEFLSADLTSLLHSAFCEAEPNDLSCSPTKSSD